MARNGKKRSHNPRIEVRGANASPEEAAAISAAIEQFIRDTTVVRALPEKRVSAWWRAGVFENSGLSPAEPSPWGGLDRAERWGVAGQTP